MALNARTAAEVGLPRLRAVRNTRPSYCPHLFPVADGHLIQGDQDSSRCEASVTNFSQLKPPLNSYWCTYTSMWTDVKHTWELTATSVEVAVLETC